MEVVFHTVMTDAGTRKLNRLLTTEVPAMPTEGNIFYDEKAGLSYRITTVFFTKDRVAAIVTPYQIAQLEIGVMFPKRKVLI